MSKVLLIDDDAELVEMLADYLSRDGFAVTTAHNGEKGLPLALGGEFALVVLDVMMPGTNGIEVLKQIRQQSQIPVIMLTARGDDTDRIIGLELGADDYVPKPCTARELAARIRAILRRMEPNPADNHQPITTGNLVLWPQQRRALWCGAPLDLTSTEFNLLEILARNAGATVSKQTLSENGLGRPLAKFDRSIEVHMSRIREKLGLLADGRSCIQTVIRQGYLLIRE
ncbi:response regulator transcription factor [Candidatus Methylospira mobilis]|uniref:Response regulator transcription factor n=1 Tax=Candidatus Methylospira mobilis TaxID=1808979 RepID=A0A5Q0BQW2_9GAMM|nr:response regulator transcription factor [Candidatus Methylospira mobilis]QFY44467.1 response regulator transcription factor [Candidatus Methylospira mobilis]WNV06105.1 response regulator transcription factor [Candidatus Methylospira mobilis]